MTPTDDTLPPPRWSRPSAFSFAVGIGAVALFVHGLAASGLLSALATDAVSDLWDFVQQAVPPDTARFDSVAEATLETFEIALVGTVLGAAVSLPLALLAARNTTPHRVVYAATRALIAFLRAIPDLVWGLIFVVAVGLGSPAGILAIAVDSIGFCGRFYAERIEEIDPRPVDALHATGASPPSVIVGAIIPAATPSFVATTLFSLESATRSAVVLGLVGAGGIGIELAISMQLLRYDEASLIILVIFAVVLGVERISASARRRVLGQEAGS